MGEVNYFILFVLFMVILIDQSMSMPFSYSNNIKNNQFQQSAVPRSSNYHIFSRIETHEANKTESSDPMIKALFQPEFNQQIRANQSAINLLPWEEDSWQYFTTTTIRSTISTQPLIINQSTSSSTTINQINSSPLPWEEDYPNSFVPNQNPSQTSPSTTTIKPTTTPNSISTTSATFPQHFIFNLIPLKPVINFSDPNWPKFPIKRQTIY